MNTPTQPESKWKTWHKVVIGIILLVFLLVAKMIKSADAAYEALTPAEKDSISNSQRIAWNNMQAEEKEVFLKDYINSDDETATDMENLIVSELHKQVNYPRTIKYDVYPVLSNFKILQADSGLVHLRGSGTCNNAFNVPIEFQYYLLIKRTASIHTLLKANVFD